MALYRVTVKRLKNSNGIRLEAGMFVDVLTPTMSNPVSNNGGELVIDAFLNKYNVDIKKAGALSMSELDVKQLS